MKKLALVPLLLISLNIAAMQKEENSQQTSKPPKKQDQYGLYSNISAKIMAGVFFGGLAYFIYKLSNNPEIEAAKTELSKHQPISIGWLDSFDERFKKALTSCRKNMSNQGLLSMLELLTAYSIATSGIISGIAFKSAHDDFQTVHPKSAKITTTTFKTAAYALGAYLFANEGTKYRTLSPLQIICFSSALIFGKASWTAANETVESIENWNKIANTIDHQELNSNNFQEETL